MFSFFKNRRRREALEKPFPEGWRNILRRHVMYYNRLPRQDREELEDLIRIFLAEKIFEGARGVSVNDEIRVTVAAQACILLLHRDTDVYPGLRSIIIYPEAFVAMAESRNGWVHSDGRQVRLGESWSRGSLVLSWNDTLHGGEEESDGRNLVFHEFAHQLDDEWIYGRGVPDLGDEKLHEEWKEVMSAEYMRLVNELHHGHLGVIDPYGATNPAEFFAVTTETFFEEPIRLRAEHPRLYSLFRRYYRQDPAALFGAPSEPFDTEPVETDRSMLRNFGEFARRFRGNRNRRSSPPDNNADT